MNRCDLNPSSTNLAVDAAAFFIGMLSWAFTFWCPTIFFVAIFVMVKMPGTAGIVLFVVLTIASEVLGLTLRWFAKGIVQRGKARMALAIILLLLGNAMPFLHRSGQPHQTIDRTIQEAGDTMALICTASILVLGFIEPARNE